MSLTQRLNSLRYFGLLWGIVGAVIGSALGIFLTLFIRDLQGLPGWDWGQYELLSDIPGDGAIAVATSVAAFTGTFGFLIGIGALTDWMSWWIGRPTGSGHYYKRENVPVWYRYFSFDTNHKVVGIQYGVTSILLLLIGGLFALIFRTELAEPGLQVLTAFPGDRAAETVALERYNTLIGSHGLLMIAGILLGIAALSNYLVPIMIGAQDMAFPRLNGFAFWISVPAAVLLLTGVAMGGFDAGWTAYPPLSVRAPIGMQFILLSIFILGFGSITGALNILVTIFMMRAPGMTWFRLPIFVWGVIASSLLQLTATQFFGLAFISVWLERLVDIPFYAPGRGGDVTLYQHIFWFYSHPTVYIWVLPGLGVISELLPVFSRKPLFGYKAIALSSLAIAFMGYLVWAHHMFTSAMDPFLRLPFMLSTLVIAVPTGIKFFNWLGTLWGGRIRFNTPMLFVLGAFVLFLVGGLTGPPSGLVVTGMHLHDTHYVVAHFHIVVFGGFFMSFLAAIYYWYPKMTGRMYSEGLGLLHFLLMAPGFLIFALSLFRIGILGMPRRYADYPQLWAENFGSVFGVELNVIATVGAFMAGASMLVFVVNLVVHAYIGKKAPANPWQSMGLEWQIRSPVPEYNFSAIPEIVGNPYDYGKVGAVYAVVAPEDRPEEDKDKLPPDDTPAIPSQTEQVPVGAGD
jgi:cytochrome c oxidase subunit 1